MSSSPRIPESKALEWLSVQELLKQKDPAVFSLEGSPMIRVLADGERPMLSIRCEITVEPSLEGLDGLHGLDVETVTDSEGRWLEISSTNPDYFKHLTDIASTIAAMTQDESLEPVEAFRRAVCQLRDMLRQDQGLSRTAELGLLGELWLLKRLHTSYEPSLVMEAWLGPESEEHDVRLDSIEIEVKATSKQARRHWIGSLGQLKPSPNRDLFLLSLHYGRSGAGPEPQSVSTAVTELRALLQPDPSALAAFDEELADKFGIARGEEQRYRTSFAFRSKPRLIAITDTSPRLLAEDLLLIERDEMHRVEAVEYLLNCEGLGCEDGTTAFLERLPNP